MGRRANVFDVAAYVLKRSEEGAELHPHEAPEAGLLFSGMGVGLG